MRAELEMHEIEPKPLSTGVLHIIGGKESEERDRLLVEGLDPGSKVVVACLASKHSQQTADYYKSLYGSMGFTVDTLFREDCIDAEIVKKKTEDAAAAFESGGNQLRIILALADPAIRGLFLDIYRRGGRIGGTSAGATMCGELMPYSVDFTDKTDEGEYDGLALEHAVAVLRKEMNAPFTGDLTKADILLPGLALLPKTIIDMHFSQAKRWDRLQAAVAAYPEMIGIGIDEDTELEVLHGGEECRVRGSGGVHVIASKEEYTRRTHEQEISNNANRFINLVDGDSFNLRTLEAFQRVASRV